MKGKYISAFLVLLVLVIVVLIVFDNKTNKVDTSSYMTINPFEKDIEAYQTVADSLLSHVETKQIRLNVTMAKDIDYQAGNIYLLADDYLQIIETNGKELKKIKLGANTECFKVLNNKDILVAFNDHLVLLNSDLKELMHSDIVEKALFTAVTKSGDLYFVADAGLRRVLVYDGKLVQKNAFNGESGSTDQHGFIVPSSHFDLAVNQESELWVVNPGIHALQNYSNIGKLRGYWSKTSFEPDGFSGCCNPFYIAFLSDGSFVTSEKGLVRIKIVESSGLLRSVVAGPQSFKGEKRAPAIAVNENDGILALDFEQKMIRFFEPK